MISDDLSTFSGKESNIPPILQLLTSLRFFASGSFQSIAGNLLHISQPSVSKDLILRKSVLLHSKMSVYLLTSSKIISFSS